MCVHCVGGNDDGVGLMIYYCVEDEEDLTTFNTQVSRTSLKIQSVLLDGVVYCYCLPCSSKIIIRFYQTHVLLYAQLWIYCCSCEENIKYARWN